MSMDFQLKIEPKALPPPCNAEVNHDTLNHDLNTGSSSYLYNPLVQTLMADTVRACYLLSNCNSILELVTSFTVHFDLFLLRIDDNYNSNSLLDFSKIIFSLVGSCLSFMPYASSSSPDETDGVHWLIELIHDSMNNLLVIKNLDFLKNILKMAAFFVLAPVSWYLGFDVDAPSYLKMLTALVDKVLGANSKHLDFFKFCTDSIAYILDSGKNWLNGNGFTSTLGSQPEFDTYLSKADYLLNLSTNLTYDKGAGRRHKPNFLLEVQDHIDKGNAALPVMGTDAAARPVIPLYRNVIIKMNAFLAKESQLALLFRESTQPLAIMIYGLTSVGKSSVVDALVHLHLNTYDIAGEERTVYRWTPGKNHMDGLTNAHSVFIADDVGSETDGSITDMGIAGVLLDVCNDAARFAASPHLEDKGKVVMNFDFVLVTANNKEMNIRKFTSYPPAALRRLHYYLTVSPSKNFRDDLSPDQISPDKIAAWEKLHPSEVCQPQHFLVQVVYFEPSNPLKALFKDVLETDNINEFLRFMHVAMIDQRTHNRETIRKRTKLLAAKLCKCGSLSIYCDCATPTPVYKDLLKEMLAGQQQPEVVFEIPVAQVGQLSNVNYTHGIALITGLSIYTIGKTLVYPYYLQYIKVSESLRTVQVLAQLVTAPVRAYKNYTHIAGTHLASFMTEIGYAVNLKNFPGIQYRRFLKEAEQRLVAIPMEVAYRWKQVAALLGAIVSMWSLNRIYTEYKRRNPSAEGLTSTVIKPYKFKDQFPAANLLIGKDDDDFEQFPTFDVAAALRKQGGATRPVWDPSLDRSMGIEPGHPGSQIDRHEMNRRIGQRMVKISVIIMENGIKQSLFNYGIIIDGNYILTVRHMWDNFSHGDVIAVTILPVSHQTHLSEVYPLRLPYDLIAMDPVNDLSVFRVLEIQPAKSIVNLFSDTRVKGSHKAMLWTAIPEPSLPDRLPQSQGFLTLNPEDFYYKSTKGVLNASGYSAICTTAPGDCTSPVLLYHQCAWRIEGVLVAGDAATSKSFFTIVSRLDLRKLLVECRKRYPLPSVHAGVTDLQDWTIESPHFKSRFNYTHGAFGVFVGAKQNCHRVKNAPQVRKSLLNTRAQEVFWNTEHNIPVCRRGFDANDENWVDTIWTAFGNRCSLSQPIDITVLSRAASGFTKDICMNTDLAGLGTLSLEQAVDGIAGVDFVNRLPVTTSAGIFYKGTKEEWTYYHIEDDPTSELHLNDVVRFDIERCEALLREGQPMTSIFKFCLKMEEPISDRKLKLGKIRGFMAGNIVINVLLRKYFGSLIRHFNRNPRYCETCVGINVHSQEWTALAREFLQFQNFFDGDFKAFDTSVSRTMMYYAFSVAILVCKRSGLYSEEDILAQVCLAEMVIYHCVLIDGDIVFPNRGNPSGQALTTIINGIIHSLLQRYCYIRKGYKVASFQKNVLLRTFGDDGLIGLSDKIPKFHFNTVREELALIGMIYTPAIKPDEGFQPRDTVDFSELSFLKREFVEDPWNGYFAPLDKSSIIKSLCFINKKCALSDNAHAAVVLNGLLFEAFHYGEDFFNEMLIKVRLLIDEFDLELFFEFPLWTFQAREDIHRV